MKISLNIGTVDRMIRVIVGCALILLAYSQQLAGAAEIAGYVVGAIAILTGLFRFCPAYMLFGIDTTGSKQS